jgi:hypothetical protein
MPMPRVVPVDSISQTWLAVLGIVVGGIRSRRVCVGARLDRGARPAAVSTSCSTRCTVGPVRQRLVQARGGIENATHPWPARAKIRDQWVSSRARKRRGDRHRGEGRSGVCGPGSDRPRARDRRIRGDARPGPAGDKRLDWSVGRPDAVDQLLQTVASLRAQTGAEVSSASTAAHRDATSNRAARTGSLQMADRAVALLAAGQPGLATLSSRIAVTQGRLNETRSATKRQIMLITWAVTPSSSGWARAGRLCRLAGSAPDRRGVRLGCPLWSGDSPLPALPAASHGDRLGGGPTAAALMASVAFSFSGTPRAWYTTRHGKFLEWERFWMASGCVATSESSTWGAMRHRAHGG